MGLSAYPASLTDKVWQKKKSATAGSTGIGDELDKLEAAYGKINTKAFDVLEAAKSKTAFDTAYGPAKLAFDSIEKFARECYKFRDFANKQAGTMKAATNKGTKKLLEDMAADAERLALALKGEADGIARAAEKRVEGYPKIMADWAERKRQLLKTFQTAKDDFAKQLVKARSLAEEVDGVAKSLGKDPSDAKLKMPGAIEAVTKLDGIAKALAKENKRLLVIFDPHRAGSGDESATTLGITDNDAAPLRKVFTDADTLRKLLVEQQEEAEALVKEAIASLKEAQAATLKGTTQAAAYLKLATDLAKAYGNLDTKLSDAMGAKSIMGKGKKYKDSWDTFVNGAKSPKPEDRPKLKTLAKERMTQRRDQVNDLEAQLKRVLTQAEAAIAKSLKGIPDSARNGDVLKQLEILEGAVERARAYVQAWEDDNSAAQDTYKDALKAIDEL